MSDPTAVSGPSADLVFYLNGKRVQRNNVDPKMLLVDYLRSPEVGLTGTKIGCKQGGCGACTVLLSEWDEATQTVNNSSINSCMRPLAALDGKMVTTVEGTGSVKSDAISQVQQCVVENNGTQCGFCTSGWVMNMTAAVAARGPKPGTKAEIEGMFDGNICRCTGYRPILYGFKKEFASDWNPAVDEQGSMRCIIDPAEAVTKVLPLALEFPGELRQRARALAFESPRDRWFRPTSMDAALTLLGRYPDRQNVRLVGGNTSIGIYPATVEDPHVFIDLGQIPSLRAGHASQGGLQLGAGMRYSELLELLDARLASHPHEGARHGWLALRYMAGRTAGTIVRNAATLAGNTMLVVRHSELGIPFPSDCFTALAALGAEVVAIAPGWERQRRFGLLEFAAKWASDADLRGGCVLLHYDVPGTAENDYVQTYKTAQRIVNSHAIVNAGLRVRLDADNRVTQAVLVVGGISPVACRLPMSEEALLGQAWTPATLERALATLSKEVDAIVQRHAAHYAELPDEGYSSAYKRSLCESYLYKFFLEVAQWRDLPVPEQVRSAAQRAAAGETRGTQRYETDTAEYPVNLPYIKTEAFIQATGEAQYVHDIPLPRTGLNAAPVQSTIALGTCTYQVPGVDAPASPAQVLAALRLRFPGVVDYITATDVPGTAVIGIGGDDPLFAISVEPSACTHGKLPSNYDACARLLLTGFGQSIGMVLAENEQEAQEAAWYLQTQLCHFVTDPAAPPVLDLPDTKTARWNSVFPDLPPFPTHIWQITRADTTLAWLPPAQPDQPDPDQVVLATGVPVPARDKAVSCTRVSSKQKVGSQLHFYMETQSCVAEVLDDRRLLLHPSSQSPTSVQSAACSVIGLASNQVTVQVRRTGGGYGGKCNLSAFASSMTAVAAWKQNRTVRMALLRQVDSAMFGHRHPVLGNYHIAIGDASDPATHGKLLGFQADFWLDGGRTYECSPIVSDCLALRSDTAYNIPNWNCAADVCRTNKTSNTSMRTMGMLQAVLIVEDAVEAAAHSVGLAAHTVREKNLYAQGDSTPYGESLDSCYMREVWDYTIAQSDFHARQQAVRDFNARNRWRKRGISLLPVKYGSGFNSVSLEQGGALIEVYSQDGMVLVRHGGVEMGQGLNTKVAQVVALALNVPMANIRVGECDTAVVPNPEGTGASTGTSFNAGAAQQACQDLRQRLEAYCRQLQSVHGDAWCAEKHVNFWDYPELGWRTPLPQQQGTPQLLWQHIVGIAFHDRVNLSAQARIAVPGGDKPDTGLTFKKVLNAKGELVEAKEDVDYFNGYTFSAACTEVEIDVLTGETVILRADVVYDAGVSLNPAVDVGQVEGGFVQGLGYVLSEELSYQPASSPTTASATRPAPGALYTVNTWEYKPPAAQSIPLEMNVILFPRSLAPQAPQEVGEPLSSKEVGEPPMTLAATAFFAVKQAVQAARADRGHTDWFQMESPATVQRVREACLVEGGDLTHGV